jgi:tripartite-type tricarboxylate transporter receptor subunit TctC
MNNICSKLAVFVLALTGVAASAQADSVAAFYKGKQMEMVIRSKPGGSYDMYARLLARHMSKHIPGNPNILPINMPGGGGIKAVNYVANIAPKDGTVLTILGVGMPMFQALSLGDNLRADLRELGWIGNLSDSNSVLVTWHTSPVKTLEDAKERESKIGGTGAGSFSVQLPTFYNNALGTKFNIIKGYAGAGAINLAMERGEVDGRGSNPWASYVASSPDYVRDKKLNVIVQVGLKREKDLPDVPLLLDLATNPEEQAMFEFVSKGVVGGRPIATTPGVPAERVEALRAAFEATLKDPEFQADAKTQNLIISSMTGKEMEQIIDDVINAPQEIRAKVKAAFEGAK